MDQEAWHKFLKAWCLMNESYFSEVSERLERAVRAPDYLHSTKVRRCPSFTEVTGHT